MPILELEPEAMEIQSRVWTAALRKHDRDDWERLARGYHTFYAESFSASDYERTWRRLRQAQRLIGSGAYLDGKLVGIAHYLYHAHVWSGTVCYLQDLYVDESVRRQGIARALISHLVDTARRRGAFRLYWSTRIDNTPARALYDRLAKCDGFIRYDVAIEGAPAE
jgi:GNAT superfamily N-acetyltransferase